MVRYILETSGDGARDRLRQRLSDEGFRAAYSLTIKKLEKTLIRWKRQRAAEAEVKAKNIEINDPQMKLAL